MPRRELPPSLEDLGRQLRSAADRELAPLAEAGGRRRRPGARRGRRAALAFLVTAGVVGGVAVGGDLLGVGAPITETNDAREEVRPRPGAYPAVAVAVDDPAGGPDWGAAPYTAQDGRDCVLAGREVGGRIGLQIDGVFRALPPTNSGACGNLRPNAPLVHEVLSPRDSASRTLVYGRVAAGYARVVVTTPGGQTPITPGPSGVFLAVYRGEIDFRDVRVKARRG